MFANNCFILFLSVSFTLFQQSIQQSSNAGLKVVISENGLNYAANLAIDRLTGHLVNKRIDNANGRNGDFSYDISNIQIKEFIRPATSVKLNADSVVTWSLSNGKIKTSFNWHYEYKKNRFLKFSDSGSATVHAGNIGISVNFKIGHDSSTGRPNFQTTHCSCDINDFDLDFHGGNGWLYNLLAGAIKSPLRDALTKELCKEARKAIDEDGNEEMATLQTDVSLGNKLFLDYKLAASPVITSGSVEFPSVGCVYFSDLRVCPASQPNMLVDATSKMLTTAISEESLNSYTNALFLSGQMKYHLAKENFDGTEGEFLDSNCKSGLCFCKLLSSLARNLPESSFEIVYQVSEAPVIHISDGRMWSKISSNGLIKAKFPNNTAVDLFSINLSTLLNVSITHNNNDFIGFKISNLKPVVVFDDNLDPNVKKGINFGIQVVAKYAEIHVNKIGEKGVPLPNIKHIVWENSEILLKDRFIRIQSDVKYID